MPCYNNRNNAHIIVNRKSTLDKIEWLEAALCVSMKAHEGLMKNMTDSGLIEDADLYAIFDFNEAGITETELEGWWSQHQAEDTLRKEKERRNKERAKAKKIETARVKALRDSAKAKLTGEDLAALGIKS